MDEESDLGEKPIKIIISVRLKRRTNSIAPGNRGRVHGGPWWLPPAGWSAGERSLLEVRKEMVKVEKGLGRLVIGRVEKQSWSLY